MPITKAPKVITKIATYFIISSQIFSFFPCFIHLSFAIICFTATQKTQPTNISMVPIGILSGFVAIKRKFSSPEFSILCALFIVIIIHITSYKFSRWRNFILLRHLRLRPLHRLHLHLHLHLHLLPSLHQSQFLLYYRQ